MFAGETSDRSFEEMVDRNGVVSFENPQDPMQDSLFDDEGLVESPPLELPQIQVPMVPDDEEGPTWSSVDSILSSRGDYSCLTSNSMLSKERQKMHQSDDDAEVPTTSQLLVDDKVAVPSVVDLPVSSIQRFQDDELGTPSAMDGRVEISIKGIAAPKAPVVHGRCLPSWIRESPMWIKWMLFICMFFLLCALFLILAIWSRQGLSREDSSAGDKSIGMKDIPARTFYSPTTAPSTLPLTLSSSSLLPTIRPQDVPSVSPVPQDLSASDAPPLSGGGGG